MTFLTLMRQKQLNGANNGTSNNNSNSHRSFVVCMLCSSLLILVLLTFLAGIFSVGPFAQQRQRSSNVRSSSYAFNTDGGKTVKGRWVKATFPPGEGDAMLLPIPQHHGQDIGFSEPPPLSTSSNNNNNKKKKNDKKLSWNEWLQSKLFGKKPSKLNKNSPQELQEMRDRTTASPTLPPLKERDDGEEQHGENEASTTTSAVPTQVNNNKTTTISTPTASEVGKKTKAAALKQTLTF